jgi:DNA-binding transcriptional LysR family regulator
MINLRGLEAFVHSVERHSFIAASERLGISASAVSKAVARLENELGIRLFNRSTRRLSLTEEGMLFYEHGRRIIAEFAEAESELSHLVAAPRGKLKISIPAIGYRMLMPILPEFTNRYPDIELDLDFNDRLVDIIAEGMDAAIRSGELKDAQFRTRNIGAFRFLLVASPGYLAQRDQPQTPTDLTMHACLRYKFPDTGQLQNWQLHEQCFDTQPPQIPCSHVFNQVEALISAAQANLGIAYLPDFAVRESLAEGKLVSILDECIKEQDNFFILWPTNRYLLPKLRAFIDFLAEKPMTGN